MELNIPSLDLQAESHGKWFTYRGSIRVKVARLNNDQYLAGAAEMREMLGDKAITDLAQEEQVAFMGELYARYILTDWDGVVDVETGEPVPYTKDAGLAVITDEKYKDLMAFILGKAKATDEYWEDKTIQTGEG